MISTKRITKTQMPLQYFELLRKKFKTYRVLACCISASRALRDSLKQDLLDCFCHIFLSFYSLSKRWNKERKNYKKTRFFGVVLFRNGILGRRLDEDFFKEERERDCLMFKPSTLEEKKGIPFLLHVSFHYLSLFFLNCNLGFAIIPTPTLLLWALNIVRLL